MHPVECPSCKPGCRKYLDSVNSSKRPPPNQNKTPPENKTPCGYQVKYKNYTPKNKPFLDKIQKVNMDFGQKKPKS